MLDCLILGDSIATGISQYAPSCVSVAKVGINSKNWLKTYSVKLKEISSKTTLISLGSNDFGIPTEEYLTQIRDLIKSEKVFWVIPSTNIKASLSVVNVCTRYGDLCVFIPEVSSDKVHPTNKGYKFLAELIK